MSSGPENTFIGAVHRHLPDDLYRMKNHNQYNGGIADCWYSGAADLWIEYKFIVVPKRDDTMIDLTKRPPKGDSILSTLQQEWLRGRHTEGRDVGVIVGCKDGGVWMPRLVWENPISAWEFRDAMRSRKELAQLIMGLVRA